MNGAAKEIGRAAVIAVTRARGMEVAGAVDSHLVGEDIGKVWFSLIQPLYFTSFLLGLSLSQETSALFPPPFDHFPFF